MQFSNNAAGILKSRSPNSNRLQSESFSTDPILSVQKQEVPYKNHRRRKRRSECELYVKVAAKE